MPVVGSQILTLGSLPAEASQDPSGATTNVPAQRSSSPRCHCGLLWCRGAGLDPSVWLVAASGLLACSDGSLPDRGVSRSASAAGSAVEVMQTEGGHAASKYRIYERLESNSSRISSFGFDGERDCRIVESQKGWVHRFNLFPVVQLGRQVAGVASGRSLY